MSGRTLLLLFIACLVVGGAILLFEGAPQDDEEAPTLLDVSKGAIDSLTVMTANDTVGLMKRGATWMVAYPFVDRANERVVDGLVSDLGTVTGTRSFPADEGLSTYGLDVPQVSVVAFDSVGGKAQIVIGETTPSGSFRYAQVGDSMVVHLIDAGLKQRLGKTLTDLRSNALLAGDRAEIDTMVQLRNGTKTVLGRDDVAWNLISPRAGTADDDAVSSFLRRLQDPVVDEFRPVSLTTREEPQATWVFRGEADFVAETLWIGEQKGAELVVESSVRPYELVVDTSLAALLLAPPEMWRSKQLLPFYSYTANELTIQKPGQARLAFGKDEDGTWRSGDWRADSDGIMELVRKLEDCRVEAFLEDEADTLWKHELVLTVRTGDFETARIVFGPQRDGQRLVFAHHLGGPAIAGCIDPDSVSVEPLNWRDRRLVSFYPYQVKEIGISASGLQASAQQKDYGEWKQSGAWADDVSVDDLLEAIHEARIVRFPEELIEPPALGEETSVLLRRDDREDLEIHLYALGPDSLAGRVGEGEICILEPGLQEALEAALRNP